METEELVIRSAALAQLQERLEGQKGRVDSMHTGEDPADRSPETAVRWVAIYGELLDFTNALLAETVRRIERSTEVAVVEELSHDRDILSTEVRRLQLHYDFWLRRAPDA